MQRPASESTADDGAGPQSRDQTPPERGDPKSGSAARGTSAAGERLDASRADRGFLRSAKTVAVLTLASRVLGLVRDGVTASLLGGSAVADALNYAWTLPNVFRRLFGEGAVSAAFIPEFTRVHEHEGRERARVVANNVISSLGALLLLIVAVHMVVFAVVDDGTVAGWFGMDAGKAALTRRFVQMLLPYLAIICVIAQFMGIMHALGEFAVPAFSPILLNLIWIVGALLAGWLLPGDTPGQGRLIVWSILVASVVQFAWHLPRLRALGMGFRVVRPRWTKELASIAVLLGPMLLAMGASQFNVLADRTIAMAHLADGGVTHLYLSGRVMQFPLGLVSIAIGTTLFPILSRLLTRGETAGAAATADLALRTNLLISLPAAAGLMLLAGPIVTLLFERGNFAAANSTLTATALVGYGAGVPFLGTVLLLNRVCFALGDTRLAVILGVITVVVNVTLDLLLVGPFAELGLAIATSVSALVNAVVLLWLLGPRLGLGRGQRLLGNVMPTLIVSGVVALVLMGCDQLLARIVPETRLGLGLRVGADIAICLAAFALVARRVCRPEWAALSSLWARSPTPTPDADSDGAEGQGEDGGAEDSAGAEGDGEDGAGKDSDRAEGDGEDGGGEDSDRAEGGGKGGSR